MKNQIKFNLILVVVLLNININVFPQATHVISPSGKYGVEYLNIKSKNKKKHLKLFLQSDKYFNARKQSDYYSYDKFKEIYSMFFKNFCHENFVLLNDSLKSGFEVIKIEKKTNNWELINDKVVKRTIYLIDVTPLDQTSSYPSYIRIISVEPLDYKRNNIIKVGEKVEMTLYSYFEKDCCTCIDENNVLYRSRYKNQFLANVFFNDIWIVKIDINNYNYYKTNNLIGLNYQKTD